MKRFKRFTKPFTGYFLSVVMCSACLGFSSTTWASHEHVEYHFDDFDTIGWSSDSTTTIPGYSGGVFLGEFGIEPVTLLIMDALPAGDDPDEENSDRCTTMSFDLLTTGTWIGNAGSFFTVTANGQELIFTTFASVFTGLAQSYPENYPDGKYPPGTGADEFFGDNAVYHIELTFPLYASGGCCTDLIIEFSATGDAQASWGLDNVIVDWSEFLPSCPPAPCLWDLDGNDNVGTGDLLELFAQWGTNGSADFDRNGAVGTSDLLILFANWGSCK